MKKFFLLMITICGFASISIANEFNPETVPSAQEEVNMTSERSDYGEFVAQVTVHKLGKIKVSNKNCKIYNDGDNYWAYFLGEYHRVRSSNHDDYEYCFNHDGTTWYFNL